MKRYTDEEIARIQPLACFDCGLPYGTPEWIEAIVSDDVWERIQPTYHANAGAGILCIQCMAKRCVEAGLEDVPVKLYGVFTESDQDEHA